MKNLIIGEIIGRRCTMERLGDNWSSGRVVRNA